MFVMPSRAFGFSTIWMCGAFFGLIQTKVYRSFTHSSTDSWSNENKESESANYGWLWAKHIHMNKQKKYPLLFVRLVSSWFGFGNECSENTAFSSDFEAINMDDIFNLILDSSIEKQFWATTWTAHNTHDVISDKKKGVISAICISETKRDPNVFCSKCFSKCDYQKERVQHCCNLEIKLENGNPSAECTTHLVTWYDSVVFGEKAISTVELVKLNGMNEKQFD